MKIDEILAAIDTGLQTAGDTAYGTDFEGACWRCRCPSETDLCERCRADLLDETAAAPTSPSFITVLISLNIERFIESLDAHRRLRRSPTRSPTRHRPGHPRRPGANTRQQHQEHHNMNTTFDGRDVIMTSVAVTNAGDGLSQSLAVDPREIHIGDTGVIALEYVCTKVGFVEIKDTECLNRVATLRAGTATLINREIVAEALDAQALKIERAKGVERLPLDGDGGEGDESE